MRGTEVRAAVKSAIEAITPDNMAHKRDRFFVADAGSSEAPPFDRQCFLERTRPQEPTRRIVGTGSPYSLEFELAVVYVNTPTLSDRVLKDGDLIIDSILSLETDKATYQQIHEVSITGLHDQIDENLRMCSYTITVIYDRRDPS